MAKTSGRRRATTPDHIADVALDLFATYGFGAVSVEDVALASGIGRRTLFRYYSSKNAIPWGDFDEYLRHFAALLDDADPTLPLREVLRSALLDFNTFDDDERAARHRLRMSVILQSEELQAYSMTMYAGWRAVVAAFVARRTGARTDDLMPQTGAWIMLAVALAGHEYWLAHPEVPLRQALGDAFDTVAAALP
jgi:mycofactocin system transcriptional regulator